MEVNSRYIPGDTQDVKQDANLVITQQRQNFPKNETINGKKVGLSVLLFFSKAARRYRHPSANNKSPTSFLNSVG
jgi:hypothetical protein